MKTSVQTILLSLFALLITPCLVIAQSFSVAVTPNEQTVAINETATYSVVITPLNGFKATVFLSVASMPEFYGKITLSATAPNLPYSNITLSVTPAITLRTFPNPTTNYFILLYEVPFVSTTTNIRIINALGMQVMVPLVYLQNGGQYALEFDATSWQAGAYTIIVQNEFSASTTRFLLVH